VVVAVGRGEIDGEIAAAVGAGVAVALGGGVVTGAGVLAAVGRGVAVGAIAVLTGAAVAVTAAAGVALAAGAGVPSGTTGFSKRLAGASGGGVDSALILTRALAAAAWSPPAADVRSTVTRCRAGAAVRGLSVARAVNNGVII